MPFQNVFTAEQKTFLVTCQLQGNSGRTARELFRAEFPDSPVPSLHTVQMCLKKFKETGNVNLNYQDPERVSV